MVMCAPARLRGPHIKTERAGADNAVGKFEFVSMCIFYAGLRGSSPAYMLGVSRGVCPLVIAGLARGSLRGSDASLADRRVGRSACGGEDDLCSEAIGRGCSSAHPELGRMREPIFRALS